MSPSDPPPVSAAVLRRPRILVVDDDPTVRRALSRMLKNTRPDLRISAAGSTVEALEAIADVDYDVVITDLQMPGGGGTAVLQALLENHPETGRIIHSSQNESGDMKTARKLAHAVVRKPASERELMQALEAVMLQAAAARPRARSSKR